NQPSVFNSSKTNVSRNNIPPDLQADRSNGMRADGIHNAIVTAEVAPPDDAVQAASGRRRPRSRSRSLRMQIRFVRSLVFSARLFARLLFWYYLMPKVIGQEAVDRGSSKRWAKYAHEFRGFAILMGGVMIKLGQFISTRVDVLPEEITGELAGLQ